METKKKHTLGMVLAGGGVKGAAHIGVLKAMEEYEIKPSCIAGTSAGALAAAFYACGYSCDEIIDLVKSYRFFKIGAFSWSKAGMMDIERLLSGFEPYFKDKNFEDLEVDLQIVATNLVTGFSEVFNSGPMFRPILASCAFPFMFAPVEVNDSLYSDGGIINNFPVETLSGKAEKIIGVYLSPLKNITKDRFTTSLDVADRAYRISNRYDSIRKLDQCTWMINPPELQNYGTFTVSKMEEIYHLGYEYGLRLAPEIKKGLEKNE
ncbi:patatin-like phospholipase family protein [Tenacibaculum tangerinum]|uniref:Patatin-like phospholipase family protein n=1 Tax=Tenacibaculum tangerinum TaxID=3038772 RepID=A0ABY8L1R8_9FLAO|nr:patatin-like phospholipase family protein [Tenacibaculum tangerinum]WGH75046.1 patatin-like phospholipase family protein [Tenacibaculum tangerinum]